MGGANILPMKDLRELLVGLGHADARTIIQSGNCVFRSASSDATTIGEDIARAIERGFGFRPSVMVLSAGNLDEAIAGNPFPQGRDDPGKVQLFFLAAPAAAADLAALEALRGNGEGFTLTGRVFYLHAPAGIGRSRLAQKAERLLGVLATARNLRTAQRIAALARSPGAEG